jgi:hypothetical protein
LGSGDKPAQATQAVASNAMQYAREGTVASRGRRSLEAKWSWSSRSRVLRLMGKTQYNLETDSEIGFKNTTFFIRIG